MGATFSVGGASPLLLHSAGLGVAKRLHLQLQTCCSNSSTRLIFIKSDMIISAGFFVWSPPPPIPKKNGKTTFWMMSPISPNSFLMVFIKYVTSRHLRAQGCLEVSLGWKRETPSTVVTELWFWDSLVVTQPDVSASAPPVSIAHPWTAPCCPHASIVITVRCSFSLNKKKSKK